MACEKMVKLIEDLIIKKSEQLNDGEYYVINKDDAETLNLLSITYERVKDINNYIE